jgi:hypothetical protein
VTPPGCDLNDPMSDPSCATMPAPECTDPATGMVARTYVGDHFAKATYTPRLAVALRLAIPLFDHVWLDGLASITFGPFGHSDNFTVATLADGSVPGGGTAEDVALPGESRTAVLLGVGLRVGAP